MDRRETVYQRFLRTGFIGGPDHPALKVPRTDPFEKERKEPDPKVQAKVLIPRMTVEIKNG